MNKLLTFTLATLMILTFTLPSFAATYLAGGLYRPYGYAFLEHNGNEASQWVDDYTMPINITYIDNNTLIGSINNEAVTMTCPNPIQYPNMYCTYWTGTSIPARIISITGDNELMFCINRVDYNAKYTSEYIRMQ